MLLFYSLTITLHQDVHFDYKTNENYKNTIKQQRKLLKYQFHFRKSFIEFSTILEMETFSLFRLRTSIKTCLTSLNLIVFYIV